MYFAGDYKLHNVFKTMEDKMKYIVVRVYPHLMYLRFSLFLKRYLQCSASYRYKWRNNRVTKGLASLVLFASVRKGLKIMNVIVFVNQMLLMRAGDVERNPGPGERDEKV